MRIIDSYGVLITGPAPFSALLLLGHITLTIHLRNWMSYLQARKLRHGEFGELAQGHAVWRSRGISSLGPHPPHPLSVCPWPLGSSLGWTTSMGSMLSCFWWGLAKADTTRGRDGARRSLGTCQASSLPRWWELSTSLSCSAQGHISCGWPAPGSSKCSPLSPAPGICMTHFLTLCSHLCWRAPSVSCRALGG